jgi:hypothetical protein
MTYRKCKLIVFGLSILLSCNIHSRPAHAQPSSRPLYDPGRIPWTELTFHAKNFWVEVTTTVQLTSLPVSEVESQLLATPQRMPIKPTSSQVSQMTIKTTIDPKFRSPVNIYNRIWFDPMDASALGRVRLRRGEDDFKKVYRFTRQGVFRHQIEPKDKKEALLAPENWTHESDNFYAYDRARPGCSGVTERSLLIYILSAADISSINNSAALCVFGKRQLHRVKLQQEGIYPLTVNFIQKTQPNKIGKEETTKAIKIAISAEPMESNLKEPEDFSFLGLHQDTAIYIDSATNFPVQISGIIPTLGMASLKLSEVQTK